MTSRAQLAMDRAAERIVEDSAVSVQGRPTTGKTVQGLVGLVPVRAEEPRQASGYVVTGLSELWNLTAAAPRRISGPSLQELDDAADAMAAMVAAQLGRVAGFAARNLGGVTVASGLTVFHLPGQHDQASHGHGSYTETYGDVLDEVSTGPDNEFVVAVTEIGDMHLAYDPPGSSNVNDREVLTELTPETANALADELDWAAFYDHSHDVPDDEGIVDSTGVEGLGHIEVWVHETGDIGIRDVQEEGLPGFDLDNDEAIDLADMLRRMADFHDQQFGGEETASGLRTFQNTPGPGTARQAAISPDDLAVIRDAWSVITDDVLGPRIAADYLAGATGQHGRLAAALPPELRALFGRPLLDSQQAALLWAAEAANRLKGIGDELWQAARLALVEGMARGESVDKLARRIRDATGVSMGRAMTIARTESMGARSAGSYDEMVSSGVVVSKTWQATGDLRTRLTHVVADGQTVAMAENFTVGGWPAQRPHDPMLPAEESVNCRCTLTYGVDTDVAAGESTLVEAVRLRRADVDRVRPVADGAAAVDELIPRGVAELLRQRIGSLARRHVIGGGTRDEWLAAVDAGDWRSLRRLVNRLAADADLTPIGEAGQRVSFDPGLHTAVGVQPVVGDLVEVIRRGYRLSRGGESVLLFKAVVEVLATAASGLWVFHLAGQHDQSTHGRGGWRGDHTAVSKAAGSPLVHSESLGGGWSASVHLEEHRDGTVIRKSLPDTDAIRAPDDQVDAEVLGGLAARAMGVKAPAVVVTGRHELAIEHVKGRTGAEVHGSQLPDSMADSDSGRLIGLTDLVIRNPDRNPGNYIVDPDGTIRPIDHGLAFGPRVIATSPFARHFVNKAGNNWADTNDMSPRDMAKMRKRLESLRRDFAAAGRIAWFNDMMDRFSAIEARAVGKRSRL